MRIINIHSVHESKRFKEHEKDPKLHYYELRHSDYDWSQPCTVEKAVLVNFWGTLVTTAPLMLEDSLVFVDKGIVLTNEEGEDLMWRASGRERIKTT